MRVSRLRWIAFVTLALALTAAAVADHHVNGKWVLDVKLGDGQGGQATLDLKEEKGKLTGTYSGALGSLPVKGTVNGDQVEVMIDSEAGSIVYKGKVSGDTMEGTCNYGQLGDGTFTGKRSG